MEQGLVKAVGVSNYSGMLLVLSYSNPSTAPRCFYEYIISNKFPSVCISEKRLRDAYTQLKKRGIPLASNQVNYSLIYRLPEENGVKAACDELGITLIAYSPIAQGEVHIIMLMSHIS